MTSPPRRPIISLKFKTPPTPSGDLKPVAPAKPASPAKSVSSARPASHAVPPPPPPPASPPQQAAKPETAKKSGPAISPDLFKAAIRAAGQAIQNVVADPEWKSEDLLHQYQAAKDSATSTHKQQAKLVSTVATRRHTKDIQQAGVENAAMRAAYAAALVALVEVSAKAE